MNRREVLQRVAWLTGGALAAPAVLGTLDGCARKSHTNGPFVLTDAQRALIAEVAELIVPRTDTPGAKDVGVPGFIESMVRDTFVEDHQQSFLDGLQDFDAQARRAHGQPFLKLSQPQRAAFAQSVHDSAVAAAQTRMQKRRRWHELEDSGTLPVDKLRAIKKQMTSFLHPGAYPATRPFILTMKELTLLGFFTSEIGATQILQYLPVPGRLEACIPLREAGNGKTWALETSYTF